MRDIEVWRRLEAAQATPQDIRAIAYLSLARRAPYLGHLVELAARGDVVVRVEALAALGGCRGMPAIRTVVAALDDDDAAIRHAAVTSLVTTATDVPARAAHALFHVNPEVRRAALSMSIPSGIAEIATYLRGDPACADLASTLGWPKACLPFALDLYDAGKLPANELVALFLRPNDPDLRRVCETEHRRNADEVDTYLTAALRAERFLPAEGRDIMDVIVDALANSQLPALDAWIDHSEHARELDAFVYAVAKHRPLTRRAAVALSSYLATHQPPHPVLLATLAAIEPRAITMGIPTTAAAAGLVNYNWCVKAEPEHLDDLIKRASGDLALAAALAGMLPNGKLAKLTEILGDDAIVESLVASDRGWDTICKLAIESCGDLRRWLMQLARKHEARFAVLIASAIARVSYTRLSDQQLIDTFVALVPRTLRTEIFTTALLSIAESERVMTVAQTLSTRLTPGVLGEVLAGVLAYGRKRGTPIVLALIRACADATVAKAVDGLPDEAITVILEILDGPDPAPRDRELAIARALELRTNPSLAAWARRVIAPPVAAPTAPRLVEAQRELSAKETAKIAACDPGQLKREIATALRAPVSGLVGALEGRVATPNALVCAALLGCADRLDTVARELDRYAKPGRDFDIELDNAAMCWLRRDDISPLAHARLYRWEHHTEALATWIDACGGVLAALELVDRHPGWVFAHTMWRGISEVVMFVRYRDRERFVRYGSIELAEYAADRVDRSHGQHAARIVVALVEGGLVPATAVRDRVLDRVADADSETRAYAARLVRLDGIPSAPKVTDVSDPRLAIDQIRNETDLDRLIQWCGEARTAVVQEAALALVIAGAPGQDKLLALLERLAEVANPVAILATAPLWDHPPLVARAHALSRELDLPAAWRFHLAIALGDFSRAFDAARDTTTTWYLRRDDWDTLERAAGPLATALALADSPHHHAYQRAIPILLTHGTAQVVGDALRRFLLVDGDRPLHLRRGAARYLAQYLEDYIGLPLLVEQIVDDSAKDSWEAALAAIPDAAVDTVAELVVTATLVGGDHACSEKRMAEVLDRLRTYHRLDRDVAARLWQKAFETSSSASTRRTAAAFVISPEVEDHRMARVANVFAWGVRRGFELTGRIFRFRATAKRRDLGHTTLSGNEVFVSPLPMLRDEPHGQDVVEGLVLHELGHHMFHRGAASEALWTRAHEEGIGHLLNLIADEHLERKLRAIDASYGDRLKRLGSYAFQHAPQEIQLASLLTSLRGSAATALIAAGLEVAYDEASVRLRRGDILATLDRSGHPLARFSRALRMGLGNRYNDPLVAKALALCTAKLRDLDMAGLYALTKQIAAMFGGACAVAQVFGGPEGLEFGDRDDDVYSGLNDDLVQQEVERILDPRKVTGGARKVGARERLWLNAHPGEDFAHITHVERVHANEDTHRVVARDTARHSTRLRGYLDELGLRWHPQKARMSGRMLDRGRLRALVTRNDPRILISRRSERRTDLFLGTVIDCSGSMSVGQNLDRARRFAVMIAEAVAPLQGVEARFFGFTDNAIFDAGDANRCDVTGLTTHGGNNDAAALYYVANLAAASHKQARVLVMISDGLPTECSVAALRGLVRELTKRRGMVCAQVAVRPLSEVCFPHYVVIDDNELDVSVAKFGRLIADLARRSLAH